MRRLAGPRRSSAARRRWRTRAERPTLRRRRGCSSFVKQRKRSKSRPPEKEREHEQECARRRKQGTPGCGGSLGQEEAAQRGGAEGQEPTGRRSEDGAIARASSGEGGCRQGGRREGSGCQTSGTAPPEIADAEEGLGRIGLCLEFRRRNFLASRCEGTQAGNRRMQIGRAHV